MGSIFKRKESPYWYMAYVDAFGVARKETTGQAERPAARAILAETEATIEAAKRKALTQARAQEIVGRIYERVTGEIVQFYSIESWLDEWLKDCKPATSSATYLRYANVVRDFKRFLGPKRLQSLDRLEAKDLREFRDKAFEAGNSPGSANMLTKVLSVPLNIAVKQQHIRVNPALSLKPITAKRKKGREMFTEAQFKALLEAAKDTPDWYGCILCGYYTGARLSDIANLTWESLDLAEGMLRFTPQKTATHGTEVSVPLAEPLLEWLKAQPQPFQPAQSVFPTLAGCYTGGSGLSGQFAALMVKAGIKRKALKEGGGRGYTTYNLSFHCFRITFISRLKAAGVSIETVMSMVGHTDEETNRHYTRVDPENQRKAIESLAI